MEYFSAAPIVSKTENPTTWTEGSPVTVYSKRWNRTGPVTKGYSGTIVNINKFFKSDTWYIDVVFETLPGRKRKERLTYRGNGYASTSGSNYWIGNKPS